jgi:radical SAM superfamily enzyme YgiQ (UPF0313 family)
MDAVRVCPPYGVYLLAATLRAAGHEVVIADLVATGAHRIDPWLGDLADAGLVGISATSLCWATAVNVLRQIRARRPEVPVVTGNIHPTLFDRYLLQRFPIDYVVRGEGEIALRALCEALDRGRAPSEVPNLTWHAPSGAIVRNPLAPKIDSEALAAYPLPDYGELPEGAYKGHAIESSRGCALDCSFCSTPYRRTWRGIPPEPFVDRLEAVLAHAGRTVHGTVHIIDDEFAMNPKRAAAVAREIRRRGLTPRLIYDARAIDFLKEGFAEEIAEYTHRFLVGAECGYDEGLKRVGKGLTCQHLEDTAKKLHALGIADRGEFSFIIGLPWETRAEVDRTLRFAAHLFACYGVIVRLNWYTQMPGSRLWEDDRRDLRVSEAMYDGYGFYNDLYLFHSGLKLDPRDVWGIWDVVSKLQLMARLRHPDREQTIDFFFPASVERYFPRDLVEALDTSDTGLTSLRQIARPEKNVAPGQDGR